VQLTKCLWHVVTQHQKHATMTTIDDQSQHYTRTALRPVCPCLPVSVSVLAGARPSVYSGLRPNSTTSICCGLVGQQVVQQTVQRLDMLRCCRVVLGLWLDVDLCRTTGCAFAADFRFVMDESCSLLYNSLNNESTTNEASGVWALCDWRTLKRDETMQCRRAVRSIGLCHGMYVSCDPWSVSECWLATVTGSFSMTYVTHPHTTLATGFQSSRPRLQCPITFARS